MKCATARGLPCFYHGCSINDISTCAWALRDKKMMTSLTGISQKAGLTSEFHLLKKSLDEISTGHKYFRLILKLHSPKELAGFTNESAC